MKHQTACRRRRVDVLGQRSEAGSALANDLYNLQKVFQGPGKTVVFGDGHNVAVSDMIQHPIQFRSFTLRSADLFGEKLASSRCRKGVGLGIEFLIVSADAGISYNHASL